MNIVTVSELKSLIDAKRDFVHLLDVREVHERAEFHIGGIFIPLGKIMNFEIEEIEHLKDEPVYVYCRSGMRSMQACMMLKQIGFTNLNNIKGGTLEWQNTYGNSQI